MTPKQFITAVSPGAQSAQKSQGILASLSIAQACLESGWGVHAPCNNLFGIKTNGWKGKVQTLTTKEVIKGKTITIKDTFRAYNSWSQSIADHAAFLRANSRYANLIGRTAYKTVCALIQGDGYATAPNYASQLISLIEQYKLYQYDTLPPLTCIDSPKGTVKGDFIVKGWVINQSGLSRVDVYADGTHGLGNVSKFTARPDVGKIYSLYSGAANSGFNFVVKRGVLSVGQHTINVAGIGKDGSVKWAVISLNVK